LLLAFINSGAKTLDFSIHFIQIFFSVLFLALPLLLSMALLVAILGLIAAYLENWPVFVGIYWAFITATTVGYGDVRATGKTARSISVMIAFIGIVFTGITVAIAVESATRAYANHEDLPAMNARIEELKKEHQAKTLKKPE
jgi:voltage-gated potassium channel